MKIYIPRNVVEQLGGAERLSEALRKRPKEEEENPMKGSRKCGTCTYASLERVKSSKKGRNAPEYEHQLFCRFMPTILRVEREGWCYQWRLKHD